MSGLRPRSAGWQVLALAVIVVGLGLSAWIPWRDHHPHGTDAMRWVTEAHVETSGWWEWVFFRRHFIGYRPVTAATFTLNSLISGWEPWSYRLVDAMLHAAAGALVWVLYRLWTDDRSWWSLVAPCVFFLHPATEDVVPQLARRSYSLSSFLGLISVVCWTHAVRRTGGGARWMLGGISALALFMALLSNEVAFVLVGLYPLLALAEIARARAPLASGEPARDARPTASPAGIRVVVGLLPQLAVAGSALAARYLVLGHLGGYHKRYFAFTRGGKNLLRELDHWAPIDIFGAALRYLAFPSSGSGLDPVLWGDTPARFLAAGALAICVLWWCTGRVWLRRRAPDGLLAPILVTWIVGYTLLYALTGSWFWRQAYPMLVPASLLVTLMLRGPLADPFLFAFQERVLRPATRAAWRVVAAVPALALLLSVAWHAPGIRGMDMAAYKGDRKHNAMLERMHADFERYLRGRTGVVFVVLPTSPTQARTLRQWLINLLGDGDWPDVTFLAENAEGTRTRIGEPLLALEVDPSGRRKLVLGGGLQWAERPGRLLNLPPSGRVWLDKVRGIRRDDVWVYSQTDAGSILLEVPLPPPPLLRGR